MAEVINLRRARKRAEKDRQERTAEERRAVFGQSKAERVRTRREKQDADRHLEGHKLDGEDA